MQDKKGERSGQRFLTKTLAVKGCSMGRKLQLISLHLLMMLALIFEGEFDDDRMSGLWMFKSIAITQPQGNSKQKKTHRGPQKKKKKPGQ